MSQQPPPPHHNPKNLNNHLHKPITPPSLPDLFLTAISLLFLFSPTKPNTHSSSLKIPFFSFQQDPRRFLRNPIMSPKNPNPHPFTNPQSLSDWLQHRLPSDSFSLWGTKPGTKNVHNLWLELFEGETSLSNSIPPVRTVEVVTVRIKNNNNNSKILIESQQELSDGTIRTRNRPLSEKMKPGETVDVAVMRAIKEELGSLVVNNSDKDIDGIVRIVKDSYRNKVEERVSVSYPGLPACYVLHVVDAYVEGLPEGEFVTEEEEEYGYCEGTRVADLAVSVKKHYWKWVDFDEV